MDNKAIPDGLIVHDPGHGQLGHLGWSDCPFHGNSGFRWKFCEILEITHFLVSEQGPPLGFLKIMDSHEFPWKFMGTHYSHSVLRYDLKHKISGK